MTGLSSGLAAGVDGSEVATEAVVSAERGPSKTVQTDLKAWLK